MFFFGRFQVLDRGTSQRKKSVSQQTYSSFSSHSTVDDPTMSPCPLWYKRHNFSRINLPWLTCNWGHFPMTAGSSWMWFLGINRMERLGHSSGSDDGSPFTPHPGKFNFVKADRSVRFCIPAEGVESTSCRNSSWSMVVSSSFSGIVFYSLIK